METIGQFNADEEANRLTDEINSAFEKLRSGRTIFLTNEQAKQCMAEHKAKVRNQAKHG
jgi:hypothetical protein